MMRLTVDTQPQIIIVACCITLRRSAYDTAGNIRSITKDGTVTKSFGYTNASWPDLLTSVTSGSTTKDILYEGQTRTSDLPASGNPVTYYNGKDYTFTWTKGRQLASATVDGKQVSYTYDMSGVRSGKQVYTTSNQRTTTYTYTTLSGKVMRQQWETRNSDDTVYQAMQSLEFVYDDGNQPFAMIYKHGQTTELYYYVLNAQGDVIALLNSAGALVASYNYGAWGNYSVHDKDGKKTTDATFIGHINPLRYRGYYYDRETRLYYLQSRYYDFANCRFINADGQLSDDFIGTNLFAYCGNNPVIGYDPCGTFDWSSFGKGVSWLAIGVTAICVGVSVLTCGVAAPAMAAIAAATVAAGTLTAVNGAAEIGAAATGYNFMKNGVFGGNEKAYNLYSHATAAAAEIGMAICGGWAAKNAPRIEAYNNIQNYTYGKSAAKHMGERSYYNSTLIQKQIIKYGSMTREGRGVYTFRIDGDAFYGLNLPSYAYRSQSGVWELTVINARDLIGHFLLRS